MTNSYLILRGGRKRAEQVTLALLARGWEADVSVYPGLMVLTNAPAAVFEFLVDNLYSLR